MCGTWAVPLCTARVMYNALPALSLLCHLQSDVMTMDFDLDYFFEVENIISTIFNGMPLFPGPNEGSQMLPPTQSVQDLQNALATPASTPSLTNKSASSGSSIYPLGDVARSVSRPSSPTPQSGDDTPKQVPLRRLRPLRPLRPLRTLRPLAPESDKTPSIYTDSSGQIILAPGKLHIVQ